MKKLAICILCCAILFAGCGTISGTGTADNENLQNQSDFDLLESLQKFDSDNTHIEGCYLDGYRTINELMAISPLVVRATPVSVESESPVAVCLVLEVAEASQPGVKTIRLRQLKDGYMLRLGEEVVLAVQPDSGEGYYNIPGGGCGLFRVNAETGTVSGMLVKSLLEDAPQLANEHLTLEDVFDLLMKKSR